MTAILTEYRLEEAFPLASRVVVMDRGSVLCQGAPAQVGEALRRQGHGMFQAMPVPMRIWAGVENLLSCPVTVRDGREWKMEIRQELPQEAEEEQEPSAVKAAREGKGPSAGKADGPGETSPAIELEEVWFKYEKDAPYVIKGLSFQAYPGQLTAIFGGNGTGKTTTLSLIAGLNTPYRGKVKIEGTELSKIPSGRLFDRLLGMLPQNPQSLFVAKTVREDLLEILSESGLSREEKRERMGNMAALCRLEELMDSHPYDLSGGEQQRAALAKVLLLQPRILLLDEPTKGLDAEYKTVFAAILRKLTAAGVTIVMVSHDIEFCAEYADKCALFFDGAIVTENRPRAFFGGNSFYTSAANRMARHVLPQAVTAKDVIVALGGTPPPSVSLPDNGGEYRLEEEPGDILKPRKTAKKLTPWRIGVLAVSGIAFLLTVLCTVLNWDGFSSFISGGTEAAAVAGDTAAAWRYMGLMAAFCVEVIAAAAALSWGRGEPEWRVQTAPASRKLSRRSVAAAAMILLAIPLTIYVGIYFFGDRKYYFISLLIILESMLPFVLIFEGRKPQARELVIIAVLCAIGVAGRVAFSMLPQFKPVVALVIIAGVAFGGEAGFLVGAVTGFVSNMFFGQGPLTPWQMFSFGIIGFFAGILFRKGLLLRNKTALCVYGGLATFFLYGGLMNPASMLTFQPSPTWDMLWPYYLQGIPFDLVHALATVVFLSIAAQPMLENWTGSR